MRRNRNDWNLRLKTSAPSIYVRNEKNIESIIIDVRGSEALTERGNA